MAGKSKTKKSDGEDEETKKDKGAKKYRTPIPEPLKKRGCTDVICLAIFIVFLVAWVIVGIFAFKDGSPEKLFLPVDSNHRRCGFDEGVENKPYLFFFDLTGCLAATANFFRCDTPQVCVKKCPGDNFYVDYYRESNQPPSTIKNKLICLDSIDPSTLDTWPEITDAVDKQHCAKWYLKSKSIANRCLPAELSSLIDSVGNINVSFTDAENQLHFSEIKGVTGIDLSKASEIIKAFSAVNEFGNAVIRDLTNTWPWIVLLIGVSVIASFLYIVIMRWIAGIVVWFSILAVIGLLGYCCYITWVKYDEMKNLTSNTPDNLPSRPDIVDQFNSYLRMKETWLAFFIISAATLLIILLIVIFLRNRLRIAVALINEGSKAVSHSWSILIFPVFPWVLQLLVIAYGILVFTFLIASGIPIYKVSGLNPAECYCSNGYQEGSICSESIFDQYCHKADNSSCETARCLYSETESRNYTVYFHLFNVLVTLWGLFFVSGFGDMALASTFATYYWTFNKNSLPVFIVAESIWRVIRYHLGTVAFGSFLLALCNWIRIMIEVAHHYLNKSDNKILKCVKYCLVCFFWCLEKFLKFLNKNAYIMCAIHGKNFCISAKNAFSLLVRNIIRVTVLDGVTGFLFFLSKLLITAAMGAISFYLFSKPVPEFQDLNEGKTYETEYYFVPIIIVCVGAFFIASIFFSVYSMAVDTLFLCFLEDSEKNDGSVEKPYFMSKSLMKILGKKNKKSKKQK